MKEISNWKKAFESDLDYISIELREIIATPACIILNGPVGAGKTTFVQHFTRCMQEGSEEQSEVNSPTYSIINEQGVIAHADFYRLKDPEEITHLELSLYAEKKKFFFIEWGVNFTKDVFRELGDEFNYYELRIEPQASQDGKSASRNLTLLDLDHFLRE